MRVRIVVTTGFAMLLLGCPSTDVVVGGSSDTGETGAANGDGDPKGDVVEDHRS